MTHPFREWLLPGPVNNLPEVTCTPGTFNVHWLAESTPTPAQLAKRQMTDKRAQDLWAMIVLDQYAAAADPDRRTFWLCEATG